MITLQSYVTLTFSMTQQGDLYLAGRLGTVEFVAASAAGLCSKALRLLHWLSALACLCMYWHELRCDATCPLTSVHV